MTARDGRGGGCGNGQAAGGKAGLPRTFSVGCWDGARKPGRGAPVSAVKDADDGEKPSVYVSRKEKIEERDRGKERGGRKEEGEKKGEGEKEGEREKGEEGEKSVVYRSQLLGRRRQQLPPPILQCFPCNPIAPTGTGTTKC